MILQYRSVILGRSHWRATQFPASLCNLIAQRGEKPVTNQFTLDDESRKILDKLSQAILPLHQWLKHRDTNGGYRPPDADNPNKFPWRNGGPLLSTDQLGVVDFILMLIRESANDIFLLRRWQLLEADPLRFFPIENKQKWRAARGLDDDVKFGIVLGDNAPGTLVGSPIARSQLYAECLPLLCAAARDRPLEDSDRAGWNKFMLELFKDQCGEWPEPRSHPSSRFMLQLLRDLLYAVLGMRNTIAEPWRSALLAEIGEYRRPGNTYSRADIEHGLAEFKKVLAEITDTDLKPPYELPDTTTDHYLQFSKETKFKG
jgi:hypothetical protein